MKKKAYITPAVLVYQVQMQDGILIGLSGQSADPDSVVLSKGSGDWDIWGNGSDSDYDDDYDY